MVRGWSGRKMNARMAVRIDRAPWMMKSLLHRGEWSERILGVRRTIANQPDRVSDQGQQRLQQR